MTTEHLEAELARRLQQHPDEFFDQVREWVNSPNGPDREPLMVALISLREKAREAGDERRETILLDLLDWIVGWCSPGSRPL